MLDTNIFVSAFLASKGGPALILKLFQLEAFDLLISEEILAEYQKVLRYERVRKLHKLTDEQISRVLEDLRTFGTIVNTTSSLTVVAGDPDDNKFFECAFDGEADYIVSGDALVLAVKAYRDIRVFSSQLFLSLFEAQE
ncbi:MAG: putative toxin-antitoxin system toxin component, PIN family [Chloroflexi bacterium]|nr:putative toxin-antitoxin system toxin component, PIN family [Chloroflexota bacterium]